MIIEIALGIVLAVVIIVFWPLLLVAAVVLLVVAIAAVVVIFAFGIFHAQPEESRDVIGIIMTAIGVIALGAWIWVGQAKPTTTANRGVSLGRMWTRLLGK